MIDNAYDTTIKLLKLYYNELDIIGKSLLENEVITKFDLDTLFEDSDIKDSIDIEDYID